MQNYYKNICDFYENIGTLANIAHNCGNQDAAKELRKAHMAIGDLIRARNSKTFASTNCDASNYDTWLSL